MNPGWPLGGAVGLSFQSGVVCEEMATHSRILDWKISWTEEPGRLQFMGSPRVRQDTMTEQQQVTKWKWLAGSQKQDMTI